MRGMRPDGNGPEAVEALLPVSRETRDRLVALVNLVRRWQKAENLIAPSTLPDIWSRHVADSAQLVGFFPTAHRWLDIGSGGGFPGLVLGSFMAAREGGMVHLVESNARKCAFLRTAARELAVPVDVHQGRIEDVLKDPPDCAMLTARALAPLPQLLDLSAPVLARGTPAAFFKGADFVREIEEATLSWDLDLVKHTNRIDDRGVILEIRRAVRKSPPTG